MEDVINQIEEFVRECSLDNEPGHDYSHIERVRKLAKYISSNVTSDPFLVDIIALLHDVNDHKLNNDFQVNEFINKLTIDEHLKKQIIDILPYLSFSKYPVLPNDFPIVGKIVSDADRLDAMGAIGIARAFSYGGNKNRSFEKTIKHFDDKLLKLDSYLYFDISKKIAKNRISILQEFFEEFNKEIKGEF